VLLLDLDHFKPVNDEYGHLIGDAVLKASAERIGSVLRGSDTLARWGGEEFAVLAPATDGEGAAQLAARAREALAEQPVRVDGIAIELTTSIGVSIASDGLSTPDALVDAADRALYEAKRAGRNCVRVY
jgi:diguanylate cyclase (GGDEF)-like protein